MEKNQIPVDKILQKCQIQAKTPQKMAIARFSVLFAQKLIRKCIENKPQVSTTKKIKPQDVKNAYESLKMIRSPQLTQKIQERKKKMIEMTKKITLEDELASKATTVKLFFKNDIEHMMTNKEHQLGFQ